MGPIFIVVAINTKRTWLRNLCLWIAIIGSVASIIGAREMFLTALLQNAIAWPIWIGVGYAIRFIIRRQFIKDLLSCIPLIPKALWRFTLNRIRELGKAFRGED